MLSLGMTWLMQGIGLWLSVGAVALAQVGAVSKPLRQNWRSSLTGGFVLVLCAGAFLASSVREITLVLPTVGLVGVGALVDLRRGRFARRRLPLPAWSGLAVLGVALALAVAGGALGQPAFCLPGVAAGFVVAVRSTWPPGGAGGRSQEP